MDDNDESFKQFGLLHWPQLLSSGVPDHFWRTLHRKIEYEIFDAGTAFSLFLIDYDDSEKDLDNNPVWTMCVSKEEGIDAKNSNEIYLINHAWTFQLNRTKQGLNSHPQLVDRMASIMGIDRDKNNQDEIINKILRLMWKYCQPYSVKIFLKDTRVSNVETQLPIWYVMDEVGCAINHSNQPNFRIVPLFYIPKQITYNILFPIRDCVKHDQVTRDFVENIASDSQMRSALLLPWTYKDFSNEDFVQKEPSPEYFLTDRTVETLPDYELAHDDTNTTGVTKLPLKVYAEYEVLKQNLTTSEFQIVDSSEEADILWTTEHFKAYEELSVNSPHKFINQFPHENVITVKDLLSIVCRRASQKHHDSVTLETFPKWLPTTYNLKTELIEFISYFQNRNKQDIDNHWIVKPFNLARGLDITITENLIQILRLPSSGPKVAQKYIENPVLFHRDDINSKVKFDIRYVIALKSVKPLKVYIYRKFFLRFANKQFSMEDFDDYEKHFTVMNYNENAELRRIEYDEFITQWNEQYPEHDWVNIENDIVKMFKELFECATIKGEPPICIAHSNQSRAIYAADLMLSWEDKKKIQPKLLEINWMPDCKRACEYYPDFFNEIFKLLFLNEIGNNFRSIV